MAGRPGSGWGFRPGGHRRPLRKPGALPGVRVRDSFTPAELEAIARAERAEKVSVEKPAVAEGAFSAAEIGTRYIRNDGLVPGKARSG